MGAKELTEIINNLKVKPGGTLRFYGDWFGRPYDNYHKILDCIFKDGILHFKFNTGETIKIWHPHNITFNENELIINVATCVEFSRYDYGKPQTKENSIIVRYSNEVLINSSIKNGMVYNKTIKKGYPAVELLQHYANGYQIHDDLVPIFT